MSSQNSANAVPLARHITGTGRPLVLVHGTGAAATRWAAVTPALAQQTQVIALDRRGRGASPDGSGYSLAAEVQDLAQILTSFPGPVDLLGHSYGGLCSLEAALLVPNLRKLILYEPPIVVPGVPSPAQETALIERLEALVAQDDRAGVLLTFVKEVLAMPPQAIEAYQASPAWPGRLAAAHTLPREMRAQGAYHFNPERFQNLTLPVLLLLGGASPARFQASTKLLQSALPNARVVTLPGQGHTAMDTAPDLFVAEVLHFLQD